MKRHTFALGVVAGGILLAATLTGCGGGGGRLPADDLPVPDVAMETTETLVYFSTGRSLLRERRVVDSTNVYESTLREVLRAMPEENQEVAIVQPEAEFNSVKVKDGVATVDWDAKVLEFEAEDKEERLALAAFLATFGQFPEVEKVAFTVEGKDSGKIGGKDVKDFWGSVALEKPWKVLRVKTPTDESGEATTTGQ